MVNKGKENQVLNILFGLNLLLNIGLIGTKFYFLHKQSKKEKSPCKCMENT